MERPTRRSLLPIAVLHLTHMDTIGVRELQQHASAALRRVERGETVGVTHRGRLVAVLIPPSSATGAGALLASDGSFRPDVKHRSCRKPYRPPRAPQRCSMTCVLSGEPVVWYLDTSAFLKLIVDEASSSAMRDWHWANDQVWSSQLLCTEALRAAQRLQIDLRLVEEALDTVTLVLPSVATYASAGRLEPHGLRSLDALHHGCPRDRVRPRGDGGL